MKKLLVAALAVIVPCVLLAQAPTTKPAPSAKTAPATGQSAEAQVEALERAWLDASQKYDVAWFERHIGDTFVNTDEEAAVTGKAAMVADVKNQVNKFDALAYDELKVHAYGNAAVATGTVAFKGVFKGKPQDMKSRFTDTWIRQGGQWQCVASHATAIPKE